MGSGASHSRSDVELVAEIRLQVVAYCRKESCASYLRVRWPLAWTDDMVIRVRHPPTTRKSRYGRRPASGVCASAACGKQDSPFKRSSVLVLPVAEHFDN